MLDLRQAGKAQEERRHQAGERDRTARPGAQTWTDRVALDGKELRRDLDRCRRTHEVTTDAAMVQQIVGNLIDNARKYTRDAADKRIWVWAKPGPATRRRARGRGPRRRACRSSERKSIFKPFRRGEQADSKAGGAGLGLALAKSWAEVLGGTPHLPPRGRRHRRLLPAGTAGKVISRVLPATHCSNDYSLASNSAAGHGGGSSRSGMAGRGDRRQERRSRACAACTRSSGTAVPSPSRARMRGPT